MNTCISCSTHSCRFHPLSLLKSNKTIMHEFTGVSTRLWLYLTFDIWHLTFDIWLLNHNSFYEENLEWVVCFFVNSMPDMHYCLSYQFFVRITKLLKALAQLSSQCKNAKPTLHTSRQLLYRMICSYCANICMRFQLWLMYSQLSHLDAFL